mgnify:CR=1 FL=1
MVQDFNVIFSSISNREPTSQNPESLTWLNAVGILSLLFAGILWSKFIGSRINPGLPSNIQEVREEEEANLPSFATVDCTDHCRQIHG